MSLSNTLEVLKAMADPSRLMILNALLESPHYVQELAQRLELAVSTVSFHLKKLEKAELVCKTKDQYYVMYWANPEQLERPLAALININDEQEQLQSHRLRQYRAKVLSAFFKRGKLIRFPVQKKKRRIVLEEMAALFEPGRPYGEAQVNAILADKFEDHCTLRRELVDGRFLKKEKQVYRLIAPGAPTRPVPKKYDPPQKRSTMKTKAELKRAYKENPPEAGIYQITNTANGKILIGKGMNIRGILNSQQAQLKWGSHMNPALQQDWNKFGAEQFTFEILDYLTPSNDPEQNLQTELNELEKLWLDKCQPYGERGYNRRPKQ